MYIQKKSKPNTFSLEFLHVIIHIYNLREINTSEYFSFPVYIILCKSINVDYL